MNKVIYGDKIMLLVQIQAEMRISVKNHTDVLIFHTAICAGASQIAFMAEEKSPTRISLRPVA